MHEMLPLRVLGETKLTTDTGSVTFTLSNYTIPAGSRHLAILVDARVDHASTDQACRIRFNGSSAENYGWQRLSGRGSTIEASQDLTSSGIWAMPVPGANATGGTNAFGGGSAVIPHYANTDNYKAVLAYGGAAEERTAHSAGIWKSTAAITSVDLVASNGSFVEGSHFAIAVVDERFVIEESVLSGSDGTFSFATLPTEGEQDLAWVGYMRSDVTAVAETCEIELNEDTTATNYERQILVGNNATGSAATASDNAFGGSVPGDSAASNVFGAVVGILQQFTRTIDDPTLVVSSGFVDAGGARDAVSVGRRDDKPAVTRIDFKPNTGTNFKDGSMMSLYRVSKRLLYRKVVPYNETSPGQVAYGAGTESSASETLDLPGPVRAGGGVPHDYIAYQIAVYARGYLSGATADVVNVSVEFNDDSEASNYARQQIQGAAAVASASSVSDQSPLRIPYNGAASTMNGGGAIHIPRYAASDRHKTIYTFGGSPSGGYVVLNAMRWANTAPITSVTLKPETGDFMRGSVFEVWGVIHPDDETSETRATKTVVAA